MVAVEAAARKPRSEAQREAARRNGAKSRGPITAEGKARASKNAIRHGLWGSVHLVVPGEDPKALEALRQSFAEDYAARGIVAACLADRLALAFWKLLRCDRLEVQLATMAPRPQRGWLEAEPGMPAALSRLPERALLERARARLDRFLLRAIALLEGGPAPRRRRRRSAGAEEELAFAAPSDPAASEDPRAAGAAEEVGGLASVVLEPRADHPTSPSAPSWSSPGPEPGIRSDPPPSSSATG
ncbi:MAG: hypothetical protein N2038_13980, partial [Geminicoccaceae bacterium]|nr:hypothetical protein [Geminicoccaceae bacterium]